MNYFQLRNRETYLLLLLVLTIQIWLSDKKKQILP